jgi:hypothetical protein
VCRVGQLSTANLFVESATIFIAPLNSTTVTGYSKIDWSGRLFLDVVSHPAYGLTTSPANTYRGTRVINAIAVGTRSVAGINTVGKNMVLYNFSSGSSACAGILTYHPNDSVLEVRIARPYTNQSASAILSATNTTPIIITTGAAHGLITGDNIEVLAVSGNTAANGFWAISAVTTNTLLLSGSVGNGAYISGGLSQVVSPVLYTSGLVLNRYTLSIQNGIATLFVNNTTVGTLTGFYTGTIGYGSQINYFENSGALSGTIGGCNYYIRGIKIGGIY